MNAIKKIESEYKSGKNSLSRHGAAVGAEVVKILKDFCTQNSEFAQAVEQSDKTVNDCIESTVKNCGSSISDIEVYRKAVTFYFPGATVSFKMNLDLGDGGFSNITAEQPKQSEQPKPSKNHTLQLDLDSLLDF